MREFKERETKNFFSSHPQKNFVKRKMKSNAKKKRKSSQKASRSEGEAGRKRGSRSDFFLEAELCLFTLSFWAGSRFSRRRKICSNSHRENYGTSDSRTPRFRGRRCSVNSQDRGSVRELHQSCFAVANEDGELKNHHRKRDRSIGVLSAALFGPDCSASQSLFGSFFRN